MPQVVEARVVGLNSLLRDLRALPKDAQNELRSASVVIAERHMVPAWRAAALQAGPWGPKIAASVRARRDRVPSVVIGGKRAVFSGGASVNMVRFPSHAGRVRQSIPKAFTRTRWMSTVKRRYIGEAVREWGDAVSRVVRDFNNGRWGV